MVPLLTGSIAKLAQLEAESGVKIVTGIPYSSRRIGALNATSATSLLSFCLSG